MNDGPNDTAPLPPTGKELAHPSKAMPRTGNAFLPTTFGELVKYAEYICKSNLVPKDYKDKPHDCAVAIQWGMELGLHPLQAIQNIAIINGRPSLWGDLTVAIVKAHAEFRDLSEVRLVDDANKFVGYEVTCKRVGQTPVVRRFTLEDAKKAGLLGKSGTWSTFTERMVFNRARAFAMRDQFADALRGFSIVEEVEAIDAEFSEVEDENQDPTPMPRSRSEAKVNPEPEPEPDPRQPDPEVVDAELTTGDVLDIPTQDPQTTLPLYRDDTATSREPAGITRGEAKAQETVAATPLDPASLSIFRSYCEFAGLSEDEAIRLMGEPVTKANFPNALAWLKNYGVKNPAR